MSIASFKRKFFRYGIWQTKTDHKCSSLNTSYSGERKIGQNQLTTFIIYFIQFIAFTFTYKTHKTHYHIFIVDIEKITMFLCQK